MILNAAACFQIIAPNASNSSAVAAPQIKWKAANPSFDELSGKRAVFDEIIAQRRFELNEMKRKNKEVLLVNEVHLVRDVLC